MIGVLDELGRIDGLQRAFEEVEGTEGVKGILILACDSNQFDAERIDPLLASLNLPVFGGIFPGILYNGCSYNRGSLVIGLKSTPRILTVHNLSDNKASYENALDQSTDIIGHGKTMFVWVDGLSSRISALIEALFNVFGLEFSYIGGGAGSLSFEQKPCLFTNDGLIEDAAVLATMEVPSGIGVSHGWNSIAGPYRVTEADSNIIKSLDWKSSIDVYRPVVEQHAGERLTDTNFFDLAKQYPFGLYRVGTERVIRDPIVCNEDGALVCVGEVPQESYVDIMDGTVESLIEAARNAEALAVAAYDASETNRTTVFIDCISRTLFLEDSFQEEVLAVYDDAFPMVGALTLGEIANSGLDYLEFYNKTAVVGVLDL